MLSSEFFRCPSPHRFVFEQVVSGNATHKWVDTGRVEETGIVLASTWLETLELSLSREWRPYSAHIPQRRFCDGYSINRKPSRCLHHLFQICRIQFTPVTLCVPRTVFASPFQHSFLFVSPYHIVEDVPRYS